MFASIPFLVLVALIILTIVLALRFRWSFFSATLPLTALLIIALASFQMAYVCTYQAQETVVSVARFIQQAKIGALEASAASTQVESTLQFIASLPLFGLFCFLGTLFTVTTWAMVIFPPQLFFIAAGFRFRWSLFVLPLNVFLPASLIAFILAFSLMSWFGDTLALVNENTLRQFLSGLGSDGRQLAAQITNQEIQGIREVSNALAISGSQLTLTAGNLLTAFLWTFTVLLMSFVTALILLWRLRVFVAMLVMVILATATAGPMGFVVSVGFAIVLSIAWLVFKSSRKKPAENQFPEQLEEGNGVYEYNNAYEQHDEIIQESEENWARHPNYSDD